MEGTKVRTLEYNSVWQWIGHQGSLMIDLSNSMSLYPFLVSFSQQLLPYNSRSDVFSIIMLVLLSWFCYGKWGFNLSGKSLIVITRMPMQNILISHLMQQDMHWSVVFECLNCFVLISGAFRVVVVEAPFFFPGLFFYVYIESPNPKNPEGPTPQAPNPINWKPQPKKTQNKTPTPKPQTPNHHKWAIIRKNYKE